MIVCLNGTIDPELKAFAQKNGVEFVSGLSSKVDCLLVGNASKPEKTKCAREQKLKIITAVLLRKQLEAIKKPEPVLVHKTVQASVKGSHLWVNKYAPKIPSDLLGNQAHFQRVTQFLSARQNTEANILLLLGDPGIGKTSSVSVLVKAAKMQAVEFNASDERTAKIMKEVLYDALHTGSITKQTNVVIMDEYDGIDDGGNSVFIKMLKEGNCNPVICIANDDRAKSVLELQNQFAKTLQTITFVSPPQHQLVARIKKIIQEENNPVLNKLSNKDITGLIEIAQGDVRQSINQLQYISNGTHIGSSTTISYTKDDFNENMFQQLEKLCSVKPASKAFELASTLFYTNDKMMPYWIQENYVNTANNIDAVANAADVISAIDNKNLNESMDFEHYPFVAALAVAYPSILLSDTIKKGKLRYPALKKRALTASADKNEDQLIAMQQRYLFTNANPIDLLSTRDLYLPIVKGYYQQAMQNNQVEDAAKLLQSENFTKDELEDVILQSPFLNPTTIAPATKAALTRRLKKIKICSNVVRPHEMIEFDGEKVKIDYKAFLKV